MGREVGVGHGSERRNWLGAGRTVGGGGANLVLTARRTDRLEKLAAELSSKHGVRGRGVRRRPDSQPGAAREIHAFTTGKGIDVELLINNAGFGAFGYTHEIEESRLLDMIQVNCSAVVHLTRLYLPAMVERRHGDILIVASTAAFQAVPFISAYAATKAFDLIFAEGIAEESRRFGVRVCALCPGSTNTEFQQVAKQPGSHVPGGGNGGEGRARGARRAGCGKELRDFGKQEPRDGYGGANRAAALRRQNGRQDDAAVRVVKRRASLARAASCGLGTFRSRP